MKHHSIKVMCSCVLMFATMANAQALDEVIDEDRYLRGLTEMQLPEVLERYLELHPPDDAAGVVEQQQHLDRLALRDTSRPASEREAIIERMFARYEKLLEANPGDPRRAVWITEQAGDAYFEWMMIDTSVWTALLGIPSREQEDSVRRAAGRMHELAERAERVVLDVIFDLEDQPGFMDDLSLQSQRRRLVDEHRDRRVPFLRGIGMHLHARFNVDERAERTNLARRAAETLNEVIPRLEGRLRREATIHAGYARLLEGDGDRAAELFAHLLDDADASPLVRFAAAVGEARRTAPRRSADASLQTLSRAAREIGVADDLFYQLLLTDQQLILRERSTADAYRAYLDLIDAQPDERRESVRRIVLSRLAGHDDRFGRLRDAPPVVQIAHSYSLATEADDVVAAIDQLEALRDRVAMRDREAALALLVLAQLYGEANRPEDAAAALLKLARTHPQSPDALPAVESALGRAAEVYRASPGTGRPLLRDGLDLLFSTFPQSDTVDHWRLVAGRLAFRENDLDAVIAHFEQVSIESAHFREARFMQVEAARRAAQTAVDAEERFAELLERIDAVERELGKPDDRADGDALRERMMLLRVYRAEAHLALDDAQQALDALDAFEQADDLPATVVAEMLPIRIQAYEALGRADEAGREIDRLVGASPDRAFALLLPMIDAAERRVDRLLRHHREEEAIELARRELLPLATRLESWHDEYGRAEHTLPVGRRLADAYRHGEECETALEWYDRLLDEHPNAMPLLIGRAECLFTLGEDAADERLAEAMTIYRRIAAAGTDHGEDSYWLSQLRMLQILDRAGRNTERIVPRIQQLRQRDSELGGEYFRRQFEQLQAKYAR